MWVRDKYERSCGHFAHSFLLYSLWYGVAVRYDPSEKTGCKRFFW